MNKQILNGQLSAAAAEAFNNIRINNLDNALTAINDNLQSSLQSQDINFIEAISAV